MHQPEDVATVIQMLRNLAEKTGALATTPQQKVVRRTEGEREFIIIEPSDPEVIYVPSTTPSPSMIPASARRSALAC